jgi:nucleoside-diphosphate-sugar epimerase
MRLFVTGGTGFIGSHFLKLALEAGHEVVALRRPGAQPVIPLPLQPQWLEASLDQVPVNAYGGCSALVHFAAQGVSPQQTDWGRAFDVNVRQSLVLFSTAATAGIPHLIGCGSCFEYGLSGERYEQIPPDAPLEPVGPYAASKAAFSLAVQAMARSSNCAISILRPFHLYGEGQHPSNFWPALRTAALSGEDFPMSLGEQIRDYQPVEEAVQTFLAHALSPAEGFKVLNVGSATPVTLHEFASFWWNRWNATGKLQLGALPYRQGEVMRFTPQI